MLIWIARQLHRTTDLLLQSKCFAPFRFRVNSINKKKLDVVQTVIFIIIASINVFDVGWFALFVWRNNNFIYKGGEI